MRKKWLAAGNGVPVSVSIAGAVTLVSGIEGQHGTWQWGADGAAYSQWPSAGRADASFTVGVSPL